MRFCRKVSFTASVEYDLSGFVANFARKVMTGQLPVPVRRLRGERVELFDRSEAPFPSLNHHLFFPDHVHEFDPN